MDIELGEIQEQFAEILWENEPIASGKLVKIAEERLGWENRQPIRFFENCVKKDCFKIRTGS